MRNVLIAIGVIISLAGIVVGAILGIGYLQRGTADFRGETAALEQIYADPNSRLTAYDYFFRACASVQSFESTINALEQELETDPSDSRVEQIQGAITANRSARASAIHDYNAKASQDYTVGQFRDSNLPHQLDENEEQTQCVAD